MDENLEYQTLQEAFSHLSMEEQKKAERCARYAEIVFSAAEANDVYVGTSRAEKELLPENQELMKYAALYHSVGKVLEPQEDEGYELCGAEFFVKVHAQSLDRKLKSSERKLVADAIKEQNETVDGKGHPSKKTLEQISFMGRILSLVLELDRLSMTLVSKSPFEDALAQMKKDTGTKFDPEFYKVMKSSKKKMIKIFEEHQQYSKLVQVAEPLIKRKPNRPMELNYRSILKTDGSLYAKEAIMKFKDSKENSALYDDVKHIIRKQNLVNPMCEYFIYELCDAYRQLKSVNVRCEWIALELPMVWLNQKELLSVLEKICQIEDVSYEALRLIVSAENLKKPVKKLSENIKECLKHGVKFMLKDVTEQYLADHVLSAEEYPFAVISCTPGCLNLSEFNPLMDWKNQGAAILVDGIENEEVLNELNLQLIDGYSGPCAGDFERESELMDRAVKIYYSKE